MTNFNGLSPDRFTIAKEAKRSKKNRSVIGKRSSAYMGPVSGSTLPAPNLPLTLGGSHAASLHDTGVSFSVLPDISVDQEHVLPIEPHSLAVLHRETLTSLQRSLTVRLVLERDGSPVKIICGSKDLGSRGMILNLPCKLDLKPGMAFDMELFLPPVNRPVETHATVRRVSRAADDDTVRYRVEVDFDKLTSTAEHEIASFVQASRLKERPPGRA